jgi:hypothetical protein
MTLRQSKKQWSEAYRLTLPQNIPNAKIPWKISRLDFLVSRRHPPSWVSSQGTNYQRRVVIISAGIIWGHFERKTQRERHQGGLVLVRQCPGPSSTCNLEETDLPWLQISWARTLFSGSGPVRLPPLFWTEKAIERSKIFDQRGSHCCGGDLVGRTTFCIFFRWLAKVRATG